MYVQGCSGFYQTLVNSRQDRGCIWIAAVRMTADAKAKAAPTCVNILCAAQLVAKVYDINPHPHWEIFLTLLCFLFSLHLYWCGFTRSSWGSQQYQTRLQSLCISGLVVQLRS